MSNKDELDERHEDPAAQSVFSTRHFRNGKNGADGSGRAVHATRRDRGVRATVVRPDGAAGLATLANRKARQSEDCARRLDGVSAVQHEAKGAELSELRGSGGAACAFRAL